MTIPESWDLHLGLFEVRSSDDPARCAKGVARSTRSSERREKSSEATGPQALRRGLYKGRDRTAAQELYLTTAPDS